MGSGPVFKIIIEVTRQTDFDLNAVSRW
ncbi:uncharacterized protein METZ01_LOCUS132669 [marine metagenome]|uniref:Uncharacterized protein n=1 Tax=marine metagenome TaxID=408172 RepID=A0A381YS25_9ZZZZ